MKVMIFSGDDTVSSREAYVDQIEILKKEYEIESVNAKDIDETLLENIFGAKDLFGKTRVLVTENFFSGQKSKIKDAVIDKIFSISPGSMVDWEEKDISKTDKDKLGKSAVVKNFKLPVLLFKFLDSLSPVGKTQDLQGFSQLAQNVEAGLIFSMIVRQFRLMILAIDGEDDAVPVWQKTKIKNQASRFGLKKLKKIHKKLLEIDFKQKTSSSPFSLLSELELLLAGI